MDFKKIGSYCFLPHHGVKKKSSTTTELRVVFNASSKTTDGISLNLLLYTGKNLLPDISKLLIRWRLYPYAIVVDIRQMYRQILVHPEDRKYQLIVWRFSEDGPIMVFQLNSLVHGFIPSPFEANRVVHQLAIDERANFPMGAEILEEETYMDDVTSGAFDKATAKEKLRQVTEICKVGGFRLRKWLANDEEPLEGLSPDSLVSEPSSLLKEDSQFSILGLQWQPGPDQVQFLPKAQDKPEKWTKRIVASRIAKLFDPLGLIGPVIISAKIILQKLWLLKGGWDDPLPEAEAQTRQDWYEDLLTISNIRIPQWLGYVQNYKSLQKHGFSDTSKDAYGAAVYLRTQTDSSNTTRLITAKSKVCPLKTLSIPKLELTAAHTLAKLVKSILSLFQKENIEIFLWSDSLDVLFWLRDHPSRWPVYVANRYAHIHEWVPRLGDILVQKKTLQILSLGV